MILFSSRFNVKYNVQCSQWMEIKYIRILSFTHALKTTAIILNITCIRADTNVCIFKYIFRYDHLSPLVLAAQRTKSFLSPSPKCDHLFLGSLSTFLGNFIKIHSYIFVILLTNKYWLSRNLFGGGKISDHHKCYSLLFHHFSPHVCGQSDRDTWLFSSCLGLAQSYRFPPPISSGQVHYNPPPCQIHHAAIALRSVTVIKWELNRSRCSSSQMVSQLSPLRV